MATKIDFSKDLSALYRPTAKEWVVVDVPPMNYVMIDGHGDPNSAHEYAQALEALYAVSYRTKFISKNELERDYVVPPLEGLWWAEDMSSFTTRRDKSSWDWTMMIMFPEWLSEAIFQRALDDTRRKKDLAALSKLRLESYHEGLAAQILHVGSYDDEGSTLAHLHSHWLPEHGYRENGKHHEIYLSDARRVEPAKLKTILRQPVAMR